MRKNLPVTDIEYPLTDDVLIVSHTDVKGKITYCNEDFLTVSGYGEDELLGKPHNIVRHPDMPPAGFENLWDTLKQGKPWVGAVKNRRKNGDFYWVLATASPIRENGQVTGYRSIRMRLPAEQRAEAEKVYAAIRENKPHGCRIDAGIIRPRSIFDRFSLFTGTIKARLSTMVGVQVAFLLGLVVDSALGGGLVPGLALSLTGIVATVLLGSRLHRVVGEPMKHLNETMLNIVEGKFNGRIVIERDDEIGEALRNLQTVQTIVRFNSEELKAAELRAAMRRKEEMARLADSFEGTVGQIVETVSSASSELKASAGTLTSTAERTQGLTSTVASVTDRASANVQSVATAAEQLASSVNEISRQVQESARVAVDAVAQAHSTSQRVSALSEAASRIGDVVELINTIAGQTNLLALNATIEAARAGEAGRGFSVVASEVKALAQQTAKATEEIGLQVNGIQAATQDSVSAIKDISSTIERLSGISSAIAAAVEQQGAATREISRNVQQASEGTRQVMSDIGDVKHGAAETGSASSAVLAAAQALSTDSGRLQSEVAKFLSSVRAA